MDEREQMCGAGSAAKSLLSYFPFSLWLQMRGGCKSFFLSFIIWIQYKPVLGRCFFIRQQKHNVLYQWCRTERKEATRTPLKHDSPANPAERMRRGEVGNHVLLHVSEKTTTAVTGFHKTPARLPAGGGSEVQVSKVHKGTGKEQLLLALHSQIHGRPSARRHGDDVCVEKVETFCLRK